MLVLALLGWSGLTVDLAAQAPAAPTNVQVTSEDDSSGPQAGTVCPAGAITISPGTSIPAVVGSYPSDTTFCIRAGVHDITSAITPKTGQTFVGESGAILDGGNWTTADSSQAAFRSSNANIDNVTIRNLTIRNMPQKGIYASASGGAEGWTIVYNEVTNARGSQAVAAPSMSTVAHNYIHHNPIGGYSAYQATGTVFEHNEIAYNGGEQKLVGTTNAIFRNNWVHHSTGDGIWYDADNTGGLIEGNMVEDSGRIGIFYEISRTGIIRNNTVRRSGDTAIFISTSKSVETYGNTLEDNFRGVQYFVNCAAVGGGTIGWDLADNSTYDNVVKLGARSGSLANMLSNASACTSTQVTPYLNGSKNNRFLRNSYTVPSTTAKWWVWGISSLKTWSEWRALGQDSADPSKATTN